MKGKEFLEGTSKIVTPIFQVNYFKKIEAFYGGLMGLLGFIVDETTNQGADIAIRALPIVSPIPNAISMYYVSQSTLGFGDYQALALAIGMELSLFGLFEIVVRMFDGYQRDKERYKIWFALSVIVAGVTTLMIVFLVGWLETADHRVLAILPLFSTAGAIALILRRWDARNQKGIFDALRESLVAMTSERDDLAAKNQALSAELDKLEDKDLDNSPITETVKKPTRQVVRQAKKSDNTKDILLDILTKEYHGKPLADLNKSALARRLNITPGTLNYHLTSLTENNLITLNGTVKVN